MKFLSSKRRVVVAFTILVALFLIRPGASHLKSRIIYSISAGVGRPVDIGSVHIRLLPRPGFDLANLVVYDDPAFGAEPILRAGEVTADLRLIPLLRGHLEIARLDLTEPSLNLALREGGRWNLESLVERAAHTASAPTAKAKSEPRPGFPYIEGSSGRINFKVGPEKKPYALTNADFSLWQESENSWGVRLKAQPFRADMNLNDTGQLQLNGTWQRANILRETPLQFTLEWTRAQLGQMTKFASGNDWGWRGAVQLAVALSGTPGKLHVVTDASLDDFRRYDITSAQSLRMVTHCEAEYGSSTREFRQLLCNAPVGEGKITLAGNVSLPGVHRYDVVLNAEHVPAAAAVSLVKRIKKNLPGDLTAQGFVQAKLSMRGDQNSGAKPQFDGQGEISDFSLSSAANKTEIGPEKIPFSFSDSVMPDHSRKPHPWWTGLQAPEGRHLAIGPITLAARAGGPTGHGWISHSGYAFTIAGEADVARVLRLAHIFGIPAPSTSADGSANLDFQVIGSWAGGSAAFTAPQVTGNAKLRSVRIPARDVGGLVEIVSGEMQFLPDQLKLDKLNAKAAGSLWTGSIEMPRGCGSLEACPVRAVLSGDEISLAQLSEWVNPKPKKAWYQVLETPNASSVLARLKATAGIKLGRLRIGRVEATHVSAVVILDKGKVEISELNADLLGGTHRGTWTGDFTAKPALCVGSGDLAAVSLSQVATAMKDDWIAGTGNATYSVKGPCTADFWPSAEGVMHEEVRNGALLNFSLGAAHPAFQFTQLSGQADLRNGKIELSHTKAESPDGRYEISGTATLEKEMSIRMMRSSGDGNTGYTISGTLAEPRIEPLARTEQAKLKPIASK